MMGEDVDHYVECYQPSLLTFEDEKERKAEIERIKLINPDYEEIEFGKEEKKKKRKRTNFQKQLDDIEDVPNYINSRSQLKSNNLANEIVHNLYYLLICRINCCSL